MQETETDNQIELSSLKKELEIIQSRLKNAREDYEKTCAGVFMRMKKQDDIDEIVKKEKIIIVEINKIYTKMRLQIMEV